MTPSSRRSLILAGLVSAALCAAPAFAASDHSTGDGSETNNPDLLVDGYEADPYACDRCAQAVVLPEDGYDLREPYDPFFDIDWSVSLRGGYSHNSVTGEHFQVLLVPQVSLTHEGNRAAVAFDADAEIVKSLTGGELRLAALNASGSFDYALDSLSVISAGASLSITQKAADDPLDLSDPDAVVEGSQSIDGEVDAAISRQFGKFDIALRGSLGRTVYGPTTYASPPAGDNSDSNVTTAAGGLRIGFEVTPIITVFADGGVERDWFDAANGLDGTTYTGKVGVSGNWSDVLEAEASVGLALRRFDAAGLNEVVGTLYDASITYRPDEDWEFSASLSTNFVPPGPDDSGTARIEYDASADVSYLINQWLTVRASAAWYATEIADSADTETGYGFGLGADYLVSDHVALNADYNFTHDEISPDPTEDEHRITLGVTIQR